MMREPLIFLPGLLCDFALFGPQVQALESRATITVEDTTTHDSVGDLAAAILSRAPEHFALAGLSMGGYVALEIMRRAPDRVARLALLDSSARPDDPATRRRRRGLIQLSRTGKFKGVTPRLLPMLVHPDRLEDEALTGEIMAMAERVGKAAFVRQQTAIMGRPDSRPGLAAIRCPTLVLCGAQDAITPPELSEEMAGAIRGAELEIVPQCGHLSTLERPEDVNAALERWLGS